MLLQLDQGTLDDFDLDDYYRKLIETIVSSYHSVWWSSSCMGQGDCDILPIHEEDHYTQSLNCSLIMAYNVHTSLNSQVEWLCLNM